jgi:RNA polymerase sigma-54 factor|tara:strand:- start:235 stop:1677 length:1443 start_codon:yes stop_codon:yes gene_type:complete
MAIGMKLNVNLRMSQKLVMTPMLQQAIKLLPLARLELAQQVRQEILENPVLEEIQEDEELIEEREDKEETKTTKPAENFDVPQKDEHSLDSPDMDWDTYFQENIDRGMSAESYTERPPIEATCKKETSLADHLMEQLSLEVNNDREKFIGSCIIGNIQSDGYLHAEISDLCKISQGSEEEVLNTLEIIQGFEPNGVGGRCLKECLAIQAQSDPNCPPLVLKLIENHLNWLEERYFPKLASDLKVPIETLIDAVKKIREFDPKPGLSFSSERIDYVVPDIVVVKTKEGYDVALNDEGIPKLRISPYYHNLLKSAVKGKTKDYLENKYRSALWMIKSIDQRRQTIYKVGKSIVKLQEEFLSRGLSYLKPMVLKDVAGDIGMHESTVSRITTNKYIDTPQGLYELKFFFHGGVRSYSGSSMSSVRVQNIIKDVVALEDERTPLTDDQMVQVLKEKNVKIARRTITKYRKKLNIPSAGKRKKLF